MSESASILSGLATAGFSAVRSRAGVWRNSLLFK